VIHDRGRWRQRAVVRLLRLLRGEPAGGGSLRRR